MPPPMLKVCVVALLISLPGASCLGGEASAPDDGDRLEQARESVRATVEWLARGIDSWFGDRPFREGGKVTDGVVSASMLARQGQGIETSLHLNARLRLPNLERRVYLFFGREDQREAVTDTPGALTRQQRLLPEARDQTSVLAGLAVAVEKAEFRVGVRGGLKPYAQARWREHWDIDSAQRADLRQTFFLTVDDHLGSTTAFSLERVFTPTLAGRWLTAGTITQVSGKLEWSSSLGLHRAFAEQRRLSLETIVSGGQAPGVGISDVGLQARWEQPLRGNWLIGEALVGHFWPRPDVGSDAIRGWAAGATVKMLF